jgi:hypothetical protein
LGSLRVFRFVLSLLSLGRGGRQNDTAFGFLPSSLAINLDNRCIFSAMDRNGFSRGDGGTLVAKWYDFWLDNGLRAIVSERDGIESALQINRRVCRFCRSWRVVHDCLDEANTHVSSFEIISVVAQSCSCEG